MLRDLSKPLLLTILLAPTSSVALSACDYSDCSHACDDQRSADFLYYHYACLARNNFDPVWDDYCFAEARLIANNNRNQCYQQCDFCYAQEGTGSPIVIQLGEGRPRISDLEGGVIFDLDDDGIPQQVAWPLDDPYLVVDLDGSGAIESGTELFGSFSPQTPRPGEAPNGFAALRHYDDDGNGVLEGVELAPLVLWSDSNHSGTSESWEMRPAADDLTWVDLQYHTSRGRDVHGNAFRYFSRVGRVDGGVGKAIDVFLLMEN